MDQGALTAAKEADEIGGSIPMEFAVFALGLLAILATVIYAFLMVSRGHITPPTYANYDSYYAKAGAEYKEL